MVPIRHASTAKTDAPTLASKRTDKIVTKLDIDELASSLADRLPHKLRESLDMGRLVKAVLDKYGEQLQESLASAIIDHL